MSSESCRVLVLGRSETPEMQPVVDVVTRFSGESDLKFFEKVAETLEAARSGWIADLVVVCQNWPDEFTSEEIRELFTAFPLARWVCCFGLWCESDGRNRDFWPLAVRVFARTAASRIEHEFAVLQDSVVPLPLTGGREENFEYDNSGEITATGQGELIRIVSPDRPFRGWLLDLLKAANYRPTVNSSGDDSVSSVVWDLDPFDAETEARLRESLQKYPQIPIVPLMNFARPEVQNVIRSLGVCPIVTKLAPQSQLLKALQNAMQSENSGIAG